MGTDPDIPILKNNSSLILRAGLSELNNPVSVSPTSVDGTSFENTDNSTSPGNITVNGNITIEPSSESEILGSTILSAKDNINVNGDISVGNFELDGSFNDIRNSQLVLKSNEGSISVTGDIDAGDTIINSNKDINIENLQVISDKNEQRPSDLAYLSSETGKITVNTIRVPFGDIIINSADVFRAKGTFPSSFSNTGFGDEAFPVSIQAGSGNKIINIQHGGIKFTDGIGVEKDLEGNTIFRVKDKDDRRRVFIRGSEFGEIIFVDEDENLVTDRPITVNSVDFDIDNVSPDESFTAGLIIKKGGIDAGLYGAFGDTFLDDSSNINVVTVPKPNDSTSGDSSGNDTANNQSSPNGQDVQRQITENDQNNICSPQNQTVAVNSTESSRGGTALNNSGSSNSDDCRITNNQDNVLKVVPDNRFDYNSVLPRFFFQLGQQ